MRTTLASEVRKALSASRKPISKGKRHYVEESRKLDRILGSNRQLAMPSRNDTIRQGEREIYQAKTTAIF